MAVMRRLALTLAGRDTSLQISLKAKGKRAVWDQDFLAHLLAQLGPLYG